MEITKNEKARNALSELCKRCSNNEMCMGTGCEPKKTLLAVIEEAEITDAYIKEWDDVIKEIQDNEDDKDDE